MESILTIWQVIILGTVQGLTEFLPISSTGHLILLEHFFGFSQERFGLNFDAALHLGTLLAVILYFQKDILSLMKAFTQSFSKGLGTVEAKLSWLIIIATVPGAILGALFEQDIETIFRSPRLVATTLILFSALLWYVEKYGKKSKNLTDISIKESVMVGLAQALALVPGVSRSGATIAAGMFGNLTREAAARFAFLVSGPIILGAGGKKVLEIVLAGNTGAGQGGDASYFVLGIFFSALSGYLTIKYFLNYLQNKTLIPFIWYRIILGIVVLVFTGIST